MSPLAQAVVSGTMSGTIYAMLAIGLIVAFQTTRVVNLAHGEGFAISGLATSAAAGQGWPLIAALVLGIAAAIAYALAFERFILRPRAHWPIASLILVSLAAAFVSQGALQVLFGSDPVSFKRLVSGAPFRVAGAIVPRQGLCLVVVGVAATLAVTQLLSQTAIGRRLRATSENAEAAQLLGVDVNRARQVAFSIAGALGGLSAVLLVPLISVDYQAGLPMTLRGFIAASLAGMNAFNAIVGGLALGLAEALITTYFGALAQDPIVFVVLICVALWQSRHVRFGGSARA